MSTRKNMEIIIKYTYDVKKECYLQDAIKRNKLKSISAEHIQFGQIKNYVFGNFHVHLRLDLCITFSYLYKLSI